MDGQSGDAQAVSTTDIVTMSDSLNKKFQVTNRQRDEGFRGMNINVKMMQHANNDYIRVLRSSESDLLAHSRQLDRNENWITQAIQRFQTAKGAKNSGDTSAPSAVKGHTSIEKLCDFQEPDSNEAQRHTGSGAA